MLVIQYITTLSSTSYPINSLDETKSDWTCMLSTDAIAGQTVKTSTMRQTRGQEPWGTEGSFSEEGWSTVPHTMERPSKEETWVLLMHFVGLDRVVLGCSQ